VNRSEKILIPTASGKNILDSIRTKSKAAFILFHHQVQKKSLVIKQYYTQQGIDSLLNYVGQISADTSCLVGGMYNYFGQINLCKDSSIGNTVAELHFVLNGNCEGFYLQTGSYLKRYYITPAGKRFITAIFESVKNKLE